MKRFLAPALVFSSFALCTLVGCEDTSTSKTKTEVSTPEGSKTIENKTTVKESGNPPVEAPK